MLTTVGRQCRALGLLVLLWLLGLSAAWAKGPVDPVARDFAWKLWGVYQQSQQVGDPAAFLQACRHNPEMTKKAFVSTLQYAEEQSVTDPMGAQNAVAFADILAAGIAYYFGDQGPTTVMQALQAGRPLAEVEKILLTYAQTLYPDTDLSAQANPSPTTAISTTQAPPPASRIYPSGQDPFRGNDLQPGVWQAVRPFYANWARLAFARAYAIPELTIEEIDSIAGHLAGARAALDKEPNAQVAAAVKADLNTHEATLRAIRLGLYADMGLFADYQAGLPAALAETRDANDKVALLLRGARAALERGQLPQAASYLQQAYASSDRPARTLSYAMATLDYRLRRARGESTPDLINAFGQTWKLLNGYLPMSDLNEDSFWSEGRLATRFWLTEMPPAERSAAFEIMESSVLAWLARLLETDTSVVAQLSDPNFLLRGDELRASLGTSLALFEQTILILESSPKVKGEGAKFMQLLPVTESLLETLAQVPGMWGIDREAGRPPFELTRGGLHSELLARLRMLGAQDTSLALAKRSQLLGEALERFQLTGYPDLAVEALIRGGDLYLELGQGEQAVERWKAALALADRYQYVRMSANAATRLARYFNGVKDWSQASRYAQQAAQKVEQSIVTAGDDPSRELSASNEEVAEITVRAALNTDRPEIALAALTRAKETEAAASRLRGDVEASVEIAAVERQKTDVALLSEQVAVLEAMPASSTRDQLLQKTQKLLADTKADFLTRSRELRQRYSELYSRVLRFDPLNLPDVQKMLSPEVAVVQYFPTSDALYIFLVTRQSLSLRSVEISQQELDGAVVSFVRAIRRAKPNDEAVARGAAQLYQLLIAPYIKEIEGKSTLVLIPTGRLNALPFACLTDQSGTPLVESKLLLEMAKPTDFMRITVSPARPIDSVVAFANATGDLPAAAAEGDAIAALFPNCKLFKGQQATKENFLAYGSSGAVLHLATHGESNNENALANYLKLSGEDRVAQDEIFGLDLENTSMVTLSACNTAVGDKMDSKFVASLAEAFWLGGSQSVIASLWAVDDTSTGLLMTEMYKYLKAGEPRAEALRKAQLAVRSQAKFEHPYYWSGFMLFGDWR